MVVGVPDEISADFNARIFDNELVGVEWFMVGSALGFGWLVCVFALVV